LLSPSTSFPYPTLFRSIGARLGLRVAHRGLARRAGRGVGPEHAAAGRPVAGVVLRRLRLALRDLLAARLGVGLAGRRLAVEVEVDRKSARLNSSHQIIS